MGISCGEYGTFTSNEEFVQAVAEKLQATKIDSDGSINALQRVTIANTERGHEKTNHASYPPVDVKKLAAEEEWEQLPEHFPLVCALAMCVCVCVSV